MEERLVPASIDRDLMTRFVGRRVLYHRSLPSTMEVARKEAGRGAQEGTIVVAEEQTARRRRMGRT